jgi:putative membrane protein
VNVLAREFTVDPRQGAGMTATGSVQEDIDMHALTSIPTAHAYAGPGGGPFFGFLMFLFWMAIIFMVVRFVVRGRRPWRDGPAPGDSARAVLAERYARGEIDVDDFQARSQVLLDRKETESSPLNRASSLFTARSARTILAERYARGEIDADEYRERLANLDT